MTVFVSPKLKGERLVILNTLKAFALLRWRVVAVP